MSSIQTKIVRHAKKQENKTHNEEKKIQLKHHTENSLAVQWLGPGIFTAEGVGSVPGWGTKILQAARHGQKQNKNQKNLTTHLLCGAVSCLSPYIYQLI